MKKSLVVISLAALVLAATGLTGCQQRKAARPTEESTSYGQGPGDVIPMNPGGEFTAGGPTDLTPRTTDGMDAAALGAGRGILESVFFDFDRAEVRASERPKLEKAATYLKENAQARVLLEGSCDWRGTTEYNLGLGDRRAQSVKVYLQNLGIAADRFDVLSKGDTEAKEGATDAEMAKDRRVEFVVIGLP